MTDISLGFEITIDAPVHTVFDYCRDPRRIYACDPTHDVVEADVVAGDVGTSALIAARVGVFAEEIAIEYTEVVPDERIVFEARPRMALRRVGRPEIPSALHVWTWTFAPHGEGTRLTVAVVEKDAPRWERAMDTLMRGMPTRLFSKEIGARLGRIKSHTEGLPARAT
jgi:uncharacterized protein YndB with AHSA1/START domain